MPPFFARITPAGYPQFPDLMIVTPLEGFTPGSPPPRPHPEPPLGIWGPPGPWPTPPIAGIPGLPGYEPPGGPPRPGHDLPLFPFHPIAGWDPGTGQWPQPPLPGTGPTPPGTPTPPGEVPPHPSTGVTNIYVWVPYVGLVGPFYVPPGVSAPTPPPPDATTKPGAPEKPPQPVAPTTPPAPQGVSTRTV